MEVTPTWPMDTTDVKNIDFRIKKPKKHVFFTFIKKHYITCIKTLKNYRGDKMGITFGRPAL